MFLTKKELLENQRNQLFRLQKFLREKNIDIDDFCDLLPGVLHMNRINSVEVVYMDKTTREKVEIEKHKIEKDGVQFLKKILDPSCMDYLIQANKTADFSDPSFILSTFQNLSFDPIKVIEKNQHQHTWCFSSKKKFSDDLTISITHPLHELGKIYQQLEKVLEENLFLKKNFKKFELLTRREKEILRLISKGQTSDQVAEQLFISVHTEKTHRKKIRYKLGTRSYAELVRFAQQFDLL